MQLEAEPFSFQNKIQFLSTTVMNLKIDGDLTA
jgi:hypothetical protein